MLLSPLWRSLGADTEQLQAILNMRLLIDGRRPIRAGLSRRRSEGSDGKKSSSVISFLLTGILFAFMGLIYALPVALIPDRVFSMTINFTLLFLMITLTLITDFSSTLFDNRDKYILFPRPINDRTLVLAKLLHVFIYLLRMVFPMSLATLAVLVWKDGWQSALLYLFPLMLNVFLALFVVNSIYLIILQVTKPGKFKDIINYFQILSSVIFLGVFYLRPRVIFFNKADHSFNYADFQWMRFLPSYWLATFWSWLGYSPTFGYNYQSNILGLIVPFICAFILIKWLAPQFSKKIGGIDSVEGRENTEILKGKKAKSNQLYLTLANLFNRSNEAKAGFIISWLQTSRSRTFRMRVYPSFAFIPFYFIYLLTQHGSSIGDAFAHLGETSKFILLLYMSSYVLVNGMNYLVMSDQYKAAWIYYASPTQLPGKIMVGALKAMWVKFFLPFFTLLALFSIWVWGISIWPDILLALVNVTLMAGCIARISFRQLPFSMMEQVKQKGSRVIRSLLTMLIPFALGVGHYFSLHLWWLKFTFFCLSSILLWLVWDSYTNTNWDKVTKEELAN